MRHFIILIIVSRLLIPHYVDRELCVDYVVRDTTGQMYTMPILISEEWAKGDTINVDPIYLRKSDW